MLEYLSDVCKDLADTWSRLPVPDDVTALGLAQDDYHGELADTWDIFANRRWDKIRKSSVDPSCSGLFQMLEAGKAYYVGTYMRFVCTEVLQEGKDPLDSEYLHILDIILLNSLDNHEFIAHLQDAQITVLMRFAQAFLTYDDFSFGKVYAKLQTVRAS